MIDVRELRVGNLIKCNCSICCGQTYAVEEIFSNSVLVDGPRIFCQDLEPIPLTPEILEKCRFLKDNGNRFIKYTGEAREFLKIYLGDKLEDMWGKYQQVDMYIMFDHIKSLHQLQNLYFALTGEELQVNIHEKEKL